MSGVKCGFTPSSDCFALTSDPSFAQSIRNLHTLHSTWNCPTFVCMIIGFLRKARYNPKFAQGHPRMVQIRTLHITYILCICFFSRNPVSRRGYLDIYGAQDSQWHHKYVVRKELHFNCFHGVCVFKMI